MARNVAYQSVGNPIQWSRLPRHRPNLAMRYHPYPEADEARFAFGLVSLGIAFGFVVILVRLLAVFGNSLLWSVLIPALIGLYLLARAHNEFTSRWLGLPFGFLVAATLYLHVPLPAVLHLLLASIAVAVFTWQFSAHWAIYCTTSPLDGMTAEMLRKSWQGYLTGLVVIPPLLILLWVFFPTLSWVIAMVVIILQVTETLRAHPNSRSITVAWRALVSWLTYDRHDVHPPGVLCSPAGRWPVRLALTGCCLLSLAVLPIDALQAMNSSRGGGASTWAVTQSNLWNRLPLLPLLIAAPAAVTFVVPTLLALPLLAEAERWRSSNVTADNWQSLVDGMQRSVDPIERESIFMGQIVHDGTPLIVPRKVYGEHAHFLGDSGGGKTSLGLCPLMEQLGLSGDCSIIVVDLKAESMELFGTLQETAKKARQRAGKTIPVKHFTNQVGRSTFAFNLLRYPYWRNLELYLRTDILCGALGLTYGADYGEGYYSSANAAVLHHTQTLFPDITTYRDLGERVGYVASNARASDLHPEIRKAGVHVKTVLDRLGSFAALNASPDGGVTDEVLQQAIDFTQVFREPQFHYFHLSSTLAPGASPEIARLVTYSLLAASTQVQRRCQVYLVIDEFQRMVARNLEYMLQLARSMGVGVILANQTMQDLRKSTIDLIPAIEANCRYRQWFSVSSAEDRQRLIESSGETVDHLITETMNSSDRTLTTSIALSEHINHRLTVNDIHLASDHPRQSIVRLSRGEGYAQYGGMPFLIESNYHITETEYEKRKHTPWPEGIPGTFVPTLLPQQGTSSKPTPPGPVVTTEVIGHSARDDNRPADPLEQFIPQPKTSRKPKARKTP